MAEVTRLDDHRPHISIKTPDGNAHAFPEETFRRIADGSLSVDDIDDRDQVLRTIVADWLETLK